MILKIPHWKICLSLTLAVLTYSPLHAEDMYLTFIQKESEPALQKSDVSLKIDNENKPITEFFSVDVNKSTPAILSHPAGRRHFLFLFDLVYSKPEDLLSARKTTEIFLKKMAEGDLVAIAGISVKGGLRFFCNFTNDRTKWYSGLNAIGNDKPAGLIEGPEGNYYPAKFSPTPPHAGLIPDQEFLDHFKTIAAGNEKKDEHRSIFLQGLVQLSFALSQVKGRKDLVLLSPGSFDTKGIAINLTPVAPQPAAPVENPNQDHETLQDITAPGGSGGIEPAEVQRRKQERGAEVIVELLEASDCHASVYSRGDQENGFYKDLAAKTGGVIWKKETETEGSADQIVKSDKSFYVVGWNGSEENSTNPHSIRLEAPSRKIESPQKWLAPKPYSALSQMEKKIRLANAMYSDSRTEFAKENFWTDFLFEEGICKIPVFVQIPGSEILKHASLKKLPLDFFGFAIAADGNIIDFYADPVSLDLQDEKVKQQLAKAGYKMWNLLWANHGTINVRWIMINSLTGETVTHTERLEIPDSDLTLSKPFFPAVNFDWLVWPKLHASQNRRGYQVQYPYRIGADFFLPELTPKIKKEKGPVCYFKIYNLLPESKNPPIAFALVDQKGQMAKISQFGLKQEPKFLEHGGMETFWKIVAFPDVNPGSYRFRIDMTDTVQRKEVIRDVTMDLL